MVFTCAAVNCSNGVQNNVEDGTSFHKFPLNDPELLQKWLSKLSRKDFAPTVHSRLCSKHFTPDDFIISSSDSNSCRKRHRSDSTLKRNYLKPYSIPTIFLGQPGYECTSSVLTRRRNDVPTAKRRLQMQEDHQFQLITRLTIEDRITCIEDLMDKVRKSSNIPDGFTMIRKSDNLLLAFIDLQEIPVIKASVKISSDLTCSVYVNDKCIPPSVYKHIIVDDQVSTVSDLANLLALVKSKIIETDEHIDDCEELISQAIDKLVLSKEVSDDLDMQIDFLIEQLRLLLISPKGHRFSNNLIVLSYTLFATSSTSYETLRKSRFLTLPSIRQLRNIANRLGVDILNNNCKNYLSNRIEKLNQFERYVTVILDEIHVVKRVELSGGRILGFSDDNPLQSATTVLCFMISSVGGTYRDIVCMIPVFRISSSFIEEKLKEVMKLIHEVGFQAVALSMDNLSANRSALVNLSGTSIDSPISCIANEHCTNQPIYCFIDTTHNIKNVYNIFQRKKKLVCPIPPSELNQEQNESDFITADFLHIEKLYNIEFGKPIKLAPHLNSSVFKPRSIEKTSTKLASSIFNENTVSALRFYSKDYPEWNQTATFLEYVLRYWRILNVRVPNTGLRKRDIFRDPVRSSGDWKICFLRSFLVYLNCWRQLQKKHSLTNETLFALTQSTTAFIDLAIFMIDRLGFNYVLFGKVSSDNIEERFGWFRQLSGGNFFLSTRQVLENERKIKVISLLKFSGIERLSMESSELEVSESDDANISGAICDKLRRLDPNNPSTGDLNSIYYVAGYISHSIIKRNKCESCTSILSDGNDSLSVSMINFDDDTSSQLFYNIMNRGGLSKPSENTFDVCVSSFKLFSTIFKNDETKKLLLSSQNHVSVFHEIVSYFVCSSMIITHCENGHNILKAIITSMCKCMYKNFVKECSIISIDKTKKLANIKENKLVYNRIVNFIVISFVNIGSYLQLFLIIVKSSNVHILYLNSIHYIVLY